MPTPIYVPINDLLREEMDWHAAQLFLLEYQLRQIAADMASLNQISMTFDMCLKFEENFQQEREDDPTMIEQQTVMWSRSEHGGMPSSSPPKAAAGAAGLLDSTMPSNPGATMGSTKVIRLPQLQPSAEYSTLRLAKLQPSAKLKSWDSRRATGSALSAVPMLPAAPMSARVERSQVPTISQLSTQYIQSSRSPQTSRSLSRSVRLFDSEIFNLDHEELSSYCLRGREANQPGAQLPSSGPQSGTAALQDEEAEQRQVETVPAHLVQIRAMYSPTKTQLSEVEGAEDGGDSPALGASATSPTGAELGVVTTTAEVRTHHKEMLQAQVPDEEWDEETMLRRELAKLRTGEDVIAFFAKNGSNSSVKFVYCKRRENVDVTEFRPYDLEVISELMDGSSSATTAAKLGEHFTISATGVVHVSPGQQSEHMSLGDWTRPRVMDQPFAGIAMAGRRSKDLKGSESETREPESDRLSQPSVDDSLSLPGIALRLEQEDVVARPATRRVVCVWMRL
ncbi:unnamed protein product [Symbiodinium necroappetens]|uniref:Uncharacterized protein n=1 Tax=Symbiodinium necroappetens TaxID=1628268 RepID=A0A812LQ78_9DINO|nr:unnamed protein product [Symbiodinium necroappetens]